MQPGTRNVCIAGPGTCNSRTVSDVGGDHDAGVAEEVLHGLEVRAAFVSQERKTRGAGRAAGPAESQSVYPALIDLTEIPRPPASAW
jgi:hypothetical protein